MSERFYINCPLQPGAVDLTGPEAHHLAVVCRLRSGDAVSLFNGDGNEYSARILYLAKRAVGVEITAVTQPDRELPFELTVAAPLPKGDRSQFLIEKLTELGVTRFVPLTTARSIIQPRETRLDKLRRHVIEASKQCGRNVLMRIEEQISWDALCRAENSKAIKIYAHPGGLPLREINSVLQTKLPIVLCVGPEGGFAPTEPASAQAAGWYSLDLGPRIVRVETAAIVLASWVIAFHSS